MTTVSTHVAHVFRRLGFGPSPADMVTGVSMGTEAVIADLLSRPVLQSSAANPNPWALPLSTASGASSAAAVRMVELMAFGPSDGPPSSLPAGTAAYNPLQERVSWILYGLLVTALEGTVYYEDMRDHIHLMRNAVGGSYRHLIRDVSIRPGMLKYLNGNLNTRTHPNENFARELMELFSIGLTHPITGEVNYTQGDVKELARALTGFQYNWSTHTVNFSFSSWDPGEKFFRGQSLGAANLVHVHDAIAAHPAFPYFVPRYFYREIVGLEPSTDTLETLAQAFGPDGDLAALVAAIAATPEFLSDEAIFSKVKQPVELVSSAARLLGYTWLGSSALSLPSSLTSLQQSPLVPPNVSGWPKGDQWLSSSNLTLWSGMAGTMAMTGFDTSGNVVGPLCPAVQSLFDAGPASTSAVRALALAGLDNASPGTTSRLDAYATGGTWSPVRAAGLFYLLLLSPEFLVK